MKVQNRYTECEALESPMPTALGFLAPQCSPGEALAGFLLTPSGCKREGTFRYEARCMQGLPLSMLVDSAANHIALPPVDAETYFFVALAHLPPVECSKGELLTGFYLASMGGATSRFAHATTALATLSTTRALQPVPHPLLLFNPCPTRAPPLPFPLLLPSLAPLQVAKRSGPRWPTASVASKWITFLRRLSHPLSHHCHHRRRLPSRRRRRRRLCPLSDHLQVRTPRHRHQHHPICRRHQIRRPHLLRPTVKP